MDQPLGSGPILTVAIHQASFGNPLRHRAKGLDEAKTFLLELRGADHEGTPVLLVVIAERLKEASPNVIQGLHVTIRHDLLPFHFDELGLSALRHSSVTPAG